MSDYNRSSIGGRLTRDAELRTVGEKGTSVAEFSVASNRKYGQTEETTFLDCTLWGKQAEVLAQYLTKGKHVIVSGRLKQESWGQEGQRRSKHVLVVDEVVFSPSTRQETSNDNEETVITDEVPF